MATPDADPARLTVVCGLPGAGKTTMARRLTAAAGAVRMCPDEWMTSMGVSLWDEPLRARLEQAQWAEARTLLAEGRDVVIEWGTWAREERDVLREWCRQHGYAVTLVFLDVPREELRARLAARNELPGEVVIPLDELDAWFGVFQAPDAAELALYDPLAVPVAGWDTRPWVVTDVAFLWEVLYLSIHIPAGMEPLPRSVLDDHALAHYLRDFGRYEGDDAQVAVADDGTALGAAFCRRTTAADPGWGFVAEGIPELGMAVVPGRRGMGIGRRLLVELLERHPRMSLSVDKDNSGARRLYESLGFVEVGEEGTAWTMLRDPAVT